MSGARSATTAVLLGAAAGCGIGSEPAAVLAALTPPVAYDDVAFMATITGHTFRPAYRFDATAGTTTIDVGGFTATLSNGAHRVPFEGLTWESLDTLTGLLPASIPQGSYDLEVRDPSGQTSTELAAFTALGADLFPPSISIQSPVADGVIGGTASVRVIVVANDGLGELRSLQVTASTTTTTLPAYSCSVTGGPSASCAFSFTAPPPAAALDSLLVDAIAVGSGGQLGEARLAARLVPPPAPAGLSPAAGSSLGGAAVTVVGTHFVPGETQVSFDGIPAVISADGSPTSLTVVAPAHAVGSAAVTVSVGGASVAAPVRFTYVAPPTVRELSPSAGSARGGYPVVVAGDNFTAATRINFGDASLLCPRLITSNRIEGIVPPGDGLVIVSASGPLPGAGSSAAASFRYDDAADAGLPGGASDGGCSGGGG